MARERPTALDQWGLPGYTIVRELGHGLDTLVYQVSRHGQGYAITWGSPADAEGAADTRAFLRQATLLACVDHPRVPRIHEVGQARGKPYLVTDLIEGEPLAHSLAAGPLGRSAVLSIAVDIGGALAAAHRAGVVHRDVRPGTILLDRDGHAWLVGFDLATAARSPRLETPEGGSPPHTAPELSGALSRPVDGRSDLYSLGAVLFECLTGLPPLPATDREQVLRDQAGTAPSGPRRPEPEASAALSSIVLRLLATDPDDRYQNGEELVAEAQDLLNGLPPDGGLPPRLVPDERDGSPGGSASFVGRQRELDQIRRRWHQAVAGHGGAVLVRGASGIGKTRLVQECLAEIRHAGHPTLYGRCFGEDGRPLAPLRQALDAEVGWARRQPEPIRASALGRLRDASAGVPPSLLPILPDLSDAGFPTDVADSAGPDGGKWHVAQAVASFLTTLARSRRGLVVCLDDGHRLDESTLEVLRRLAPDLPTTPLLVIVTVRDDDRPHQHERELRAALAGHIALDLALNRLSVAEIGRLLRAQLPGADLDPQPLAARCGGNPRALLEHVRLVLEMGLLRPSWGTWLLDLEGLRRLDPARNASDVVRQRVETLGERTRLVLRVAAVCGEPFTSDLVTAVSQEPGEEVRLAMQEALDRRLVEVRTGGAYGFPHGWVVESLLADLDEAARARLHQRVAQLLDTSSERDDPATTYRLARHYLRGDTLATPRQLIGACQAAASAAMTANAPVEALAFLEPAQDVATASGLAPSSELLSSLGEAYHQCGRFAEAEEVLLRALDVTTDAVHRARVLSWLARTNIGFIRLDEATQYAHKGLVELGESLPASGLPLRVTTAARVIGAVVLGLARSARRSLLRGHWWRDRDRDRDREDRDRDRDRTIASIYEILGQIGALQLRPDQAAMMAMRALPSVHRLGPSLEYVRAYAPLGYGLRLLGLPRLAAWPLARALRCAEVSADPRLIAMASHMDALSAFLCGLDDGQRLSHSLRASGRWLDASVYRDGVKALCRHEAIRGNVRESLAWYEQARSRLGSAGEAVGWDVALVAAEAALGRPADLAHRWRNLPLVSPGQGLVPRLEAITARIHAAVEQNDLGDSLDTWIGEFHALGLDPRRVNHRYRIVYAHMALGYLERLRVRTDLPRQPLLRAAVAAVENLGRNADCTLLRGYHQVALASLRQCHGDNAGATRLLTRAERTIDRADAPILDYEAARVGARALAGLDRTAAARKRAQYALMLATEYGWARRAHWISAEFGGSDPARYGPQWASTAHRDPGGVATRRLEALEQVSHTALRILDPEQLSQVVLDKTIEILSADRALLFLTEDGALLPHLGRERAGQDIPTFESLSPSLEAQVRNSFEAIVVTGTEESLAPGPASALALGLRSAMVAPLRLEGRLLGAVYLEGGVVRGAFTAEDAGLFLAIVNHIALSLETARTAALEAAIRVAREQLATAERLHAAMRALNETGGPGDVLSGLVQQLLNTLPGDDAWLLRYEDSQFWATLGPTEATSDREFHVAASDAPHLTSVMAGELPVSASTTGSPPPELAPLLSGAPSWLILPMVARDGPLGLVVMVSRVEEAYQLQRVETGAVLVCHAMTAYDNARNLARVHALATTDELTGIPNRRHFLDRASAALARVVEEDRPATIVVIGVNGLSVVNETHGHLAGDQVLVEVADRIRRSIRRRDILGRYGGEEFAALLLNVGSQGPAIADRIRAHVVATPVPTDAGPVTVSVSLGVASLMDGEADVSALLTRAERGLHQATAAAPRVGGRQRA